MLRQLIVAKAQNLPRVKRGDFATRDLFGGDRVQQLFRGVGSRHERADRDQLPLRREPREAVEYSLRSFGVIDRRQSANRLDDQLAIVEQLVQQRHQPLRLRRHERPQRLLPSRHVRSAVRDQCLEFIHRPAIAEHDRQLASHRLEFVRVTLHRQLGNDGPALRRRDFRPTAHRLRHPVQNVRSQVLVFRLRCRDQQLLNRLRLPIHFERQPA